MRQPQNRLCRVDHGLFYSVVSAISVEMRHVTCRELFILCCSGLHEMMRIKLALCSIQTHKTLQATGQHKTCSFSIKISQRFFCKLSCVWVLFQKEKKIVGCVLIAAKIYIPVVLALNRYGCDHTKS